MSVGHAKNIGWSQINMRPFFLYYQYITNMFLLVSPAVLVFIGNSSNFQDFLSFLMCIYTPSK